MLFLFSGINNSFYCDKTKGKIEIGQIAVVRVEPVVTTIVALSDRRSIGSYRSTSKWSIMNPLI